MSDTPFEKLLKETVDEIEALEFEFDRRSNAGLDNNELLARLMELRERREWLNEVNNYIRKGK